MAFGSMLGISGKVSAKTILAPLSRKALAVEGNVNEGMMTSSPGPTSERMAAISKASLHEVVSKVFAK